MAEAKVPLFCSMCGTRLEEEIDNTTRGYDPYTGERLVDTNTTRYCPNPTLKERSTMLGFSKTTTRQYHPSWTYDGNQWVQ